jgi:hypothetical protein
MSKDVFRTNGVRTNIVRAMIPIARRFIPQGIPSLTNHSHNPISQKQKHVSRILQPFECQYTMPRYDLAYSSYAKVCLLLLLHLDMLPKRNIRHFVRHSSTRKRVQILPWLIALGISIWAIIYIHTYVHMYVCICMYTYVCIHRYVYICMYT